MAYFEKGDKRWIAFPSKPFEVDGEKKYLVYCGFDDFKISKSFQDEVLKALDDYLNKKS